MNKPLSGLLVYQLIMSLAVRLSLKFHICPRSFASRPNVHLPNSLVVVGASEHQFGDMMKFIFQINLSAIAALISSLLSPVSLFRTSFSVVFGRPLLRGSSGDHKISEPAGSL